MPSASPIEWTWHNDPLDAMQITEQQIGTAGTSLPDTAYMPDEGIMPLVIVIVLFAALAIAQWRHNRG